MKAWEVMGKVASTTVKLIVVIRRCQTLLIEAYPPSVIVESLPLLCFFLFFSHSLGSQRWSVALIFCDRFHWSEIAMLLLPSIKGGEKIEHEPKAWRCGSLDQ